MSRLYVSPRRMVAADPGSAPARRTLADELIAPSYLRAFSGEDLAAARTDCEQAREIMEALRQVIQRMPKRGRI